MPLIVNNSYYPDINTFWILQEYGLEDKMSLQTLLAIFLTTLPLHSICNDMSKKEMKGQDSNNLESNSEMDINTDENVSGLTHLNEPVEDDSELEKVKAELEEIKDKYLRKVAEFENFQRRNARERMEMIQTAGKEVIIDLLDVLDDSDRAKKQMEESTNAKDIREGAFLVFNKLKNILQSRGLKAMETLNQDFNPDLHEAVTELAAPSEKQKGKVLDEIAKGYYLNDKIIRHAKVVVGK